MLVFDVVELIPFRTLSSSRIAFLSLYSRECNMDAGSGLKHVRLVFSGGGSARLLAPFLRGVKH